MKKVKLAEITNIVMGQSPSGEKCNENGIGVPLLNGPTEFGVFHPFATQFTTDAKKVCEIDDILFCVRGSTTGRINIANEKYAIGRGLAAISHKKDRKLNIYIKYLIEYNLKGLLKNTNGSTFPNLTTELLKDFELYVVKDDVQQKIAAVLSALDAKIELNNRINAELEAMAKTLYDYWFVQFNFPDKEGKPYISNGGKMLYNPQLKREIPEGWEVGSLGDYSKVKSGFAFKSTWWKETGVPVLKITNIQEDYTISFENCSFVSEDKVNYAKDYKANSGDVIIAMTGATIGKFAIIPAIEQEVLINQRVGLFELGENPVKKLPFLINSLRQSYFRERIFFISSGCAQPNISSAEINSIPLIIPPKNLLDDFNRKMIPVYETILKNQTENQHLSNLRDWLLPMLMNGQVKVGAKEDMYSMAAEPQAKYI